MNKNIENNNIKNKNNKKKGIEKSDVDCFNKMGLSFIKNNIENFETYLKFYSNGNSNSKGNDILRLTSNYIQEKNLEEGIKIFFFPIKTNVI